MIGAIAEDIAEAFYGKVPAAIIDMVEQKLTLDLWEITERFRAQYC